MFRMLISVSGVGPKVAMGMLSRATGRDIAVFLRTGDEKALAQLPGIGKKSAARLVVELGQRVPQAGDQGQGPEFSGAGSPDGRGFAMAALQGDKTLAQLASQYDVHVNQIQTWRNQLKQNMVSLFDSGIDKHKDHDAEVKLLQAKIGQLTMENDFLATVLKP